MNRATGVAQPDDRGRGVPGLFLPHRGGAQSRTRWTLDRRRGPLRARTDPGSRTHSREPDASNLRFLRRLSTRREVSWSSHGRNWAWRRTHRGHSGRQKDGVHSSAYPDPSIPSLDANVTLPVQPHFARCFGICENSGLCIWTIFQQSKTIWWPSSPDTG